MSPLMCLHEKEMASSIFRAQRLTKFMHIYDVLGPPQHASGASK